MGQIRQDRSELTELILSECDLLEAPTTPHIETIRSHILQLQSFEIERWAEATQGGMEPLQCHDNAMKIERSAPSRKTYAVAGWWHVSRAFVFHSVVRHEGRLICVTPILCVPAGGNLRFTPDPWIELSTESRPRHMLFGRDVPRRIPLDRAFDLALAHDMRIRLARGDDPEKITAEPFAYRG